MPGFFFRMARQKRLADIAGLCIDHAMIVVQSYCYCSILKVWLNERSDQSIIEFFIFDHT